MSNLPPIPEDVFDGEHQSTVIPKEQPRCSHKKVYFDNGTLRCPCGAGWQGSNLHELYKALTSHNS